MVSVGRLFVCAWLCGACGGGGASSEAPARVLQRGIAGSAAGAIASGFVHAAGAVAPPAASAGSSPVLSVPTPYDANKLHRLVFGYHGSNYTGKMMRQYLDNEKPPLLDNSIFVYPDGLPLPNEPDNIAWVLDPNGRDIAFHDALYTYLTTTYWVAANGCSSMTVPGMPEQCQVYQGCDPDNPVIWCPHVNDGGHQTPSFGRTAYRAFLASF